MKKVILFFALLVSMLSCKQEPTSNFQELDLIAHGVPISIMAPPASEVTTDDLGVWKDIQIKGEPNFFVQLIASDATTFNVDEIISAKKQEATGERYFSRIVEEKPDGFIFEKKIDSLLNYDFRLIKLQGDKEYSFQTGFLGTFSEDDVKKMYQACQFKK